ncbi:MAG: GGDEF domain-containing protein [Candidatus Omnitrophica bacterium]|nr:GGDEF domain-containing protein [Candidatus Omnitrophota bacterium]MDD5670578.1 GGDEF domain-containing protein [Candidatus Omnitrophota bacterium]
MSSVLKRLSFYFRPGDNSLSLRFPGARETAFRHYCFKQSVGLIRLGHFLGIFFYGSVALIDPYVIPTIAPVAFLMRFGIVIPVIVASLIYSFFMKNETVLQLMGILMVTSAGISAVLMMLWDPGVGGYIYIGGVLLVILYGYIFIRLRFFYASLAGWVVAISYLLAAFLKHEDWPVLISNSFFCLIANAIGMSASYSFELSLRNQYVTSIGMKRVNRELQRLSNLDSLTKIANRRFFDTRLDYYFERAKITSTPMSLIIIDVDFFKAYNDSLGHLSGDDCLVRVADRVRRHAKSSGDLTARFGGEEFAMILVDCPREVAAQIAEEIRREVMTLGIRHPCSPISTVITISLGVATWVPGKDGGSGKLVREADAALYRAKANGRNRVEMARE